MAISQVQEPDTTEEQLGFFEELHQQRWDDHRLYHHSRINQSLHLLSACCFIASYVLVFFKPAAAVMLGWVIAMWARQIGHFFFEPRTYDSVNQVSHEHKEDIKIGYNLARKRILQSLWALAPVVLYLNPNFFGLLEAHASIWQFLDNVALLWIWLAILALLVRVIQLFFIYNVQTGLVWATKIITDPFNDFKTYSKSPLYLMRGQLIDPMGHVNSQ